MNFGEQLKRIRRMLRDPDANIWERAFLKTSYNDIQRDIQRKVRFLENATVLNYPPRYQIAYLYDWEWQYLPSGQTRFYQCLRYHQQGDYSYCHRWEPQTDYGTDDVIDDEGAHFTQPWEAFAGLTPGEQIAIKFPENFHTAKYLAWDKWPIEYKTKKAITSCDPSYITRSGRPLFYYREDDVDNSFIPYPRPSAVSWDDEEDPISDPDWNYTYSFESAYVTGEKFTKTDSTNSREYIYSWESDLGSEQEHIFHGMWLFEVGAESSGLNASVSYLDGDTTTQLGVISRRDGSLLSQDTGLAVDILSATDDFFLIYDAEPTDVNDDADESDFPIFLRKYIEYGVLERAFGVLTDGKIATLKEYWRMRYDMGIEAIKRYQSKRRQDRDYCLSTQSLPVRRSVRHAALPSTYPVI